VKNRIRRRWPGGVEPYRDRDRGEFAVVQEFRYPYRLSGFRGDSMEVDRHPSAVDILSRGPSQRRPSALSTPRRLVQSRSTRAEPRWAALGLPWHAIMDPVRPCG
jgi:hypothetical protein